MPGEERSSHLGGGTTASSLRKEDREHDGDLDNLVQRIQNLII